MKKAALLYSWFVITPLLIFISLILFKGISEAKGISNNSSFINLSRSSPYEMFAALPQSTGDIVNTIKMEDARPYIVENFLKENNSPLLPYSQLIVEVSDQYNIDFRLIPAIAMKESSGGKVILDNSYNAWGFENGRTIFESWPNAIEKVAKTLKEGYIDKGLLTPYEIMPKYAPPSVEKGGPWAQDVDYFMHLLE